MPKATLTPKTKQQKQIDQMEKAIYRIEQDTIQLRKELKEHIENIWEVYKPLKKLIKYFGK
jgi:septal ring factor EnvC (AmiA/AmiB activator)|tara:strand:+ start:671 stop:853 length:183 start_codon:yes stop_codon:yes gene_type:complete